LQTIILFTRTYGKQAGGNAQEGKKPAREIIVDGQKPYANIQVHNFVEAKLFEATKLLSARICRVPLFNTAKEVCENISIMESWKS